MDKELSASPLAEVDIVFVDVETTGFSVKSGGEILEVGAVRARNGETVGEYASLVCPVGLSHRTRSGSTG